MKCSGGGDKSSPGGVRGMKLGVYDFSGGYKGIERAVPGIFPKMTAFYIYTYLENIAYGKKRSKPH